MEIDPVCGMHVEPSSAAAAWPFGGVTYFFCSLACRLIRLPDPHAS